MSRGELYASKWCRRTKDDRLRKERKEKKGRNLIKVDRYLQGKRGVPTTGKFRLVAGNTIRAEARYSYVISYMPGCVGTFDHRNLPGPLALKHSRRPLTL